jgi:hypothetical protein
MADGRDIWEKVASEIAPPRQKQSVNKKSVKPLEPGFGEGNLPSAEQAARLNRMARRAAGRDVRSVDGQGEEKSSVIRKDFPQPQPYLGGGNLPAEEQAARLDQMARRFIGRPLRTDVLEDRAVKRRSKPF